MPRTQILASYISPGKYVTQKSVFTHSSLLSKISQPSLPITFLCEWLIGDIKSMFFRSNEWSPPDSSNSFEEINGRGEVHARNNQKLYKISVCILHLVSTMIPAFFVILL